jgi:hypothetical protein
MHAYIQTKIVGDSARKDDSSEDDNSYIQQGRSGYLQLNTEVPRNVTVLKETQGETHLIR